MTFRAEIENMDDLEKKIVGLRKDMSKILETATQAGANVIADEADHLAPGPHIDTEVVELTWSHADIEIGPDKEHWYYKFFETGTAAHEVTPRSVGGLEFPGAEGEMVVRQVVFVSGMPASPFMRPAFDGKKNEAEEAVGREFLQVINKYLER